MSRVVKTIASCLLMSLSACTSLVAPEPPRTAKINTESFHISGAIAARNRHQAWTASFDWIQKTRDDYQIILTGPLGNNSITISMHGNMLTYREGQKVIHSSHPEALLAKETGIKIPLRYLDDWVIGKAAAGPITSLIRDTKKDIIVLKQAGFILYYSDYRNHYPHKIQLLGPELRLKMVIKHWDRP